MKYKKIITILAVGVISFFTGIAFVNNWLVLHKEYPKIGMFDVPFDTNIWGNAADWIQTICAIIMLYVAFRAFDSWKDEKKLEYEAEAITKSFDAMKLCKRILDIGGYKDEFISFEDQDSLVSEYPLAASDIMLSISYDRMHEKFQKDIENLRILSLKMKTLYKGEQNTVFYKYYNEINEIIKKDYSSNHDFLKKNTNLACMDLQEYFIWMYRGVVNIDRLKVKNFMDNYPDKNRIIRLEKLFVDVHFNEGAEVISKIKTP